MDLGKCPKLLSKYPFFRHSCNQHLFPHRQWKEMSVKFQICFVSVEEYTKTNLWNLNFRTQRAGTKQYTGECHRNVLIDHLIDDSFDSWWFLSDFLIFTISKCTICYLGCLPYTGFLIYLHILWISPCVWMLKINLCKSWLLIPSCFTTLFHILKLFLVNLPIFTQVQERVWSST